MMSRKIGLVVQIKGVVERQRKKVFGYIAVVDGMVGREIDIEEKVE
jgi:hypothetical protein